MDALTCTDVAVRALYFFFFQAEDGIRDLTVTGVQTCALPILAEGAERSTTRKGRDGGSPGSNEPQSWPFSGRFYPLRWPPPSKRGRGRARSQIGRASCRERV